MSDYPMLISNKLHSFRNFIQQIYTFICTHFSLNQCFLGPVSKTPYSQIFTSTFYASSTTFTKVSHPQ